MADPLEQQSSLLTALWRKAEFSESAAPSEPNALRSSNPAAPSEPQAKLASIRSFHSLVSHSVSEKNIRQI